jgi:hypothetical protein
MLLSLLPLSEPTTQWVSPDPLWGAACSDRSSHTVGEHLQAQACWSLSGRAPAAYIVSNMTHFGEKFIVHSTLF